MVSLFVDGFGLVFYKQRYLEDLTPEANQTNFCKIQVNKTFRSAL